VLVGVDIECVTDIPDLNALTAFALSRAEQANLSMRPTAERLEAFLSLWTMKEAFLKMTGDGLLRPPSSCEIAPQYGCWRTVMSGLHPARSGLASAIDGVRACSAALAVNEPPLAVYMNELAGNDLDDLLTRHLR
jgi:4'-phosphopantetheinyl transferase